MILYYSVNVYLSPLMLLVQWIVYTRLAIWSKVLYTLEIQTPKQVLVNIILDYLYKFRGSYLVIFLNSYLAVCVALSRFSLSSTYNTLIQSASRPYLTKFSRHLKGRR